MTLAQRRLLVTLVAGGLLLSACGTTPTSSQPTSPTPEPTAQLPALLTARSEVGPPPGPVKPFRAVMEQEVQVYDGWVSMRIVMRNTGEEPVTFLNTLYDYEPMQLYEPLVRLEWTDGSAAAFTRNGRFFPTPAILQPGEEAIYLMGGQRVLEEGNGQLGDLVTHIKYCPTRGMDDVPGVPLEVSDLEWEQRGEMTVIRGVMHQTEQGRRFGRPAVGVEFVDADGNFVGAVVDDAVGEPLDAGESRAFEISGPGVRADAVTSLRGVAWVR